MTSVAERIIIPYCPRAQQQALHDAMDTARFGAIVCHRRFGKTVWAINHLQKAALLNTQRAPRYAYIAPTYRQGKQAAWDYMQHYAAPLPQSVNHSELRIDYANGAQVRIYGSDNPDALRGIYLDGVVCDEYGLMDPRLWGEVIRPLLSDRGGWAVFMGTPNGKNQFWDIVQTAKTEPGWLFREYKSSQTGIIPAHELEAARRVMTADQYQQEYECSFEASVKGSIFGQEFAAAHEQGRVCRVPVDPALPVDTDWDLGVDDRTAIVFSQSLYSGEVRIVDYYENAGVGLDHYKAKLLEKGYAYGTHYAPHDIQVTELTSGNTRLEIARKLGIPFLPCERVQSKGESIHAAKMLFPRCWFDAERTKDLLSALQSYRWDWNAKIKDFTPRPLHDWASHAADAFQGLSYRQYAPKRKPERVAAAELRRAQRDPGESFTWQRRELPRGGYQ